MPRLRNLIVEKMKFLAGLTLSRVADRFAPRELDLVVPALIEPELVDAGLTSPNFKSESFLEIDIK